MRSISRTISGPSRRAEPRPRLRHLADTRWLLLAAAVLLSLVGLLTIHSATSELTRSYLPLQALRVVAGLVLALIVFSIDYHVLTRLSIVIYGLAVGALVLVLVAGYQAGGAQSWLNLGLFRLQPSEFAKIATALLLARYLAEIDQRYLDFGQIVVATAIVAVPAVLVALESDLGSAVMFVPMLVGTILIAGVRWRMIAALVAVGLVVGPLVWTFAMRDYQKQRVMTFVAPGADPLGAGYQIRQSKIAVGSGELTGKGYMQGTQSQLRFLPARHTDFIFAVLAEEWGFLGVVTVMLLYLLFFSNAVKVAERARDRAGVLLVVGLLSGFSFHVLYNTGMVVGLVPITGIPLPFLSYGGSFTLANFMAVGLILGVDFRRYVNR